MAEVYIGIKFKFIEKNGEVPNREKLLELDRFISKFIKTKENEGNMSVREGDGFLIKKTGTRMTVLKKSEVVFVSGIGKNEVYATGGTPSSESMMHYEIYRNRKDANIVLHFHEDKMLNKKFGKIVGPFEYGTEEQAQKVGETVKKNDFIEIKDHGLIIVAKNKKELEKHLREKYEQY